MTELSTDNVLHPRQVNELRETKERLGGMLAAPPYIRDQLADGGAGVVKQIKDVDNMLKQAPEPIPAEEIDAAVKTEKLLREEWSGADMPTDTEMRRNSPGCTDKNIAWSKKHRTRVAQWKNLRRRLHASGISEHRLADEGDVSNIEMYRPHGGSGELSMDNAQIAGKDWRLPPPGAGPVAIMSDRDAEILGQINPELLAAMATLTNDQRAEVLETVRVYDAIDDASELVVDTGDSNVNVHAPHPGIGAGSRVGKSHPHKRKGRQWTDEERKAASDRYHAARLAQEAEAAFAGTAKKAEIGG